MIINRSVEKNMEQFELYIKQYNQIRKLAKEMDWTIEKVMSFLVSVGNEVMTITNEIFLEKIEDIAPIIASYNERFENSKSYIERIILFKEIYDEIIPNLKTKF